MRITDISILEFKGLKVEGALIVYADSRDDTIRPILRNPEFGIRNSGNFSLWNPESGKICFWNVESWVLESGIQLKESGIPLTIQNPSFTEKCRNPVPGIDSMEPRIRDCLGFSSLTRGEHHAE